MAFLNVPDEALPTGSPTAQLFLTEPVTLDLNTDDNQVVWKNPSSSGRVFRPTAILLYNPSIDLTTASVSMGTESTTYANLLANGTNTGLDGVTKFKVVPVTAAGAVEVASGTTIYLKNNTKQGAAATVQCRLQGWLETS